MNMEQLDVMREFFKSELKTLKAKTGLNQYENISSMTDAKFQFKILLDSMVASCNEFNYIPDTDKKRIIQEQIIRDQDFTGLNSRVIWKWLNLNKDHYWTIFQMKQKPEAFEPCPPEKVDFYVKKLKESIEAIGNPKTSPQPPSERFGESLTKGFIMLTPTEIERKELHIQYLRENYHPVTRDKLPNWKEESDWISDQLSKDI